MKTLEQIRSDSLASRTFAMQLLVGFSLVGSVLTLVGIYGVLSLSVASGTGRPGRLCSGVCCTVLGW